MGKLYILMRNDLYSLNAGKSMAQASHASSQFINNYYNLLKRDYDLNDPYKVNQEYIENWLNEGNGFGTTIVMEGSNNNISEFVSDHIHNHYLYGYVKDTTYPFLGQKELLDLLSKDEINDLGIVIDDTCSPDKYGMVKCTRPEVTCYWFFVPEEAELPFFVYNIELHR